jgi:hypothetical protein
MLKQDSSCDRIFGYPDFDPIRVDAFPFKACPVRGCSHKPVDVPYGKKLDKNGDPRTKLWARNTAYACIQGPLSTGTGEGPTMIPGFGISLSARIWLRQLRLALAPRPSRIDSDMRCPRMH